MTERNLPQLLGDARRWFDEALAEAMRAAGEKPVTIGQQAVFAALDPGGTTVAELSRRMGVTRQSTHQAVQALVRLGLLEQSPDPASARRLRTVMTEEGHRVDRVARAQIARLEEELAGRIGGAALRELRRALSADWGPPFPEDA
ncbi:MarR family winged helix-turn-helix transcriptional regulator [Actinocorallia populi]|uniref:MarR family winged helix-turn-helix transcriptional regulator n=1 Tax=Actinocorallia populi TaxID=2079200 RepID=UPI000D0887A9|nr:MarR family winged helix-turn-helix transcriptional regulator [Actinocorallia populi]